MGIWGDIYDGAKTTVQNIGHRLNPGNWPAFQESESTKKKREDQFATGEAANKFADVGEAGYGNMTAEAQAARDYLRKVASGQESVAQTQLRQAAARNINAQRSMAASASPQNGPMASLNAMNNAGRINAGMSGQVAMASLAERQAAQKALADAIYQQRQQDMQVALGSRQNAVGAYGGVTPEGSWMDKYASPIASALGGGARLGGK